jgi:hypothetical protein
MDAELVPMKRLLKAVGIETHTPGRRAACILHGGSNPTDFSWREDGHWHCFSCGASGDRIALVRSLRQCGFREATRSNEATRGTDSPTWEWPGVEGVAPKVGVKGTRRHAIRRRGRPPAVRLHGDVSLHFSAAHHRPSAPDCHPENAWGNDHYNRAARFWAKIFGINFAVGVVTGIPLEFQFGTNWSSFSKSAGGVIGQALAMEGVFSFFLESSFLGLFLFGEKRPGRAAHWFAAFMVFAGSWLSGYFIVATDAWMQHPVAYLLGANGMFGWQSFWGLVLNSWMLWQYPHTMLGAVQTGCFAMAAIGAFCLLSGANEEYGQTFVRIGVLVGVVASVLQLWPTGDG